MWTITLVFNFLFLFFFYKVTQTTNKKEGPG